MHSVASTTSINLLEYGGTAAAERERYVEENEWIIGQGLVRKVKRPWYVIHQNHWFRHVWNLVLLLLLVYTATVFPYRLCFVHFNLDGSSSDSTFWSIVEGVVEVLFYIDLVIWFFFSYRSDENGREIFDMVCIAKRYLKTYFILNFIACIPAEVFAAMLDSIDDAHNDRAGVNSAARLTRLQRLSRLVRMARLLRLARAFDCAKHDFWQQVEGLRYIRMINYAVGLLWIVHLVACGWYLTAAFHDDVDVTWVKTRGILDQGPYDQWVHANYFVLTVFTSVGFGDMSASTIGEIGYVMFTMVLGAIVQSIVLGEVIRTLLMNDQKEDDKKAQNELLDQFTSHVKLNSQLTQELTSYFNQSRKARHELALDELKEMITSNSLPRELMELLCEGLFKGALKDNKFMTACLRYEIKLPVRFPLLLALALNERHFAGKEMVYCAYDYPGNVFLVMKGTFSYIAFPTPRGGVAELPAEELQEIAKQKSRPSRGKTGIPDFSLTPAAANACQKTRTVGLFPYQLFGRGTYFGDLELMLHKTKRACGARCELQEGKVLVLHKNELASLIQEFRQFGHAWRAKAKRRQHRRQVLASQLQIGRDVLSFAVVTIQRYWRFKHGYSDIDEYMYRPRKSGVAEASRRVRTDTEMRDLCGRVRADTENFHDAISVFRDEMHTTLRTICQEIAGAPSEKEESEFAEKEVVIL